LKKKNAIFNTSPRQWHQKLDSPQAHDGIVANQG